MIEQNINQNQKKINFSKNYSEDETKKVIEFIKKLNKLIPQNMPENYKERTADFSRIRKLPFKVTVIFIIFSIGIQLKRGIDHIYNLFVDNGGYNFFKNKKLKFVNRSAITNARKKISWECIRNIYRSIINLIKKSEQFLVNDLKWKGLNVYAIDGSKITLPANKEIQENFDPHSGHENKNGQGYYPKCLIVTLYEVLKGIPIEMIVAPSRANERKEALKLLDYVEENDIIIFDRGYPWYVLICDMLHKKNHFLIKCQSKGSFKSVDQFVNSKRNDDIIRIKKPAHMVGDFEMYPKYIDVRAIKVKTSDEKMFVLITDLMDYDKYKTHEIIELYNRRWEIELHFRDEKITLEIEKFHSKSVNGILQELYAAIIILAITRMIIIYTKYQDIYKRKKGEFQFRNAISCVSKFLYILYLSTIPKKKERLIKKCIELIERISEKRYYKPKKPRKPQPRINKSATNKWIMARLRKENEKKNIA